MYILNAGAEVLADKNGFREEKEEEERLNSRLYSTKGER